MIRDFDGVAGGLAAVTGAGAGAGASSLLLAESGSYIFSAEDLSLS